MTRYNMHRKQVGVGLGEINKIVSKIVMSILLRIWGYWTKNERSWKAGVGGLLVHKVEPTTLVRKKEKQVTQSIFGGDIL